MLQKAVNDALNVSESDVIAAKGSKGPVCPGQEPSTPTTNRSVIPSVPATLVGEIAACLSKQLTTLLVSVFHTVRAKITIFFYRVRSDKWKKIEIGCVKKCTICARSYTQRTGYTVQCHSKSREYLTRAPM